MSLARPPIDRQFYWLLMAMIAFGYAVSVLPPGFVFDPIGRETLDPSASSSFKLVWVPLIGLSLGVIFARFKLAGLLLPELNRGLLVFLLFCLASAIWSPDAARTFRQAFSIVGVSLLATAFTLAAWRPGRLESVLLPASTAMLALSLLVAVLAPGIGIHHENQFELMGAWRGITYQKNGLGQLSAIAMIFWCHAWVAGKTRPRYAALGVALAVLLLLKSRSSTALLVSTIACITIVLRLRPPLRLGSDRRSLSLLLALTIAVPLLLYLLLVGSFDSASYADAFGKLFGKDATFSGRTYIWAELLREIPRHPWLGIGFNSFWFTPAANEAVLRLGWPCPSGHNGYLDLINTLGVVGFLLFIGFVALHLQAIKRVARFDPAMAALHLGLFIFVALTNLTESGWFVPITLTHMLIMLSSAELSRAQLEQRLRQAQQPSGTGVVHRPSWPLRAPWSSVPVIKQGMQ